MKLLIATGNKGKAREFAELLKDMPIETISLADLEGITVVEETGTTFLENAELKACGYAQQAGQWTLADDSGLEVAALDNSPGVFSARYGGADTGYDQKMAMLLDELAATGDTNRSAAFVCMIAIADDSGELIYFGDGYCRGTIAEAPRGENGFGYDPIFIPDGYDKTFGELSSDEKEQISHRAQATAKIIRFLRDFTNS